MFENKKKCLKQKKLKKCDDFWVIEQVRALLATKVYRHLAPKTIAALMKRLREEVRNFKRETCVKLVHAMPILMHEIWKNKGHKVPKGFDSSKSPKACKLVICQKSSFD